MLEVINHPATPAPSLIWVYTVGMMAFMAMNAVLALLLKHRFHLTENEAGFYYSYIGVIGVVMRAILLGPLVRRFGELSVMKMGVVSLTIGLISMAMAPSIPLLAIAVLFVPVGTALLFPSTTALLSRLAPTGQTGQVMGVQQAFGGVSRLVGPIWAGAAYQYLGTNAPFLISAGLMLGVGGLTRRVTEPQKSPPKPVEGEPALPMSTESLDPAAIQPIPSVTQR
jgi:MFS family permease